MEEKIIPYYSDAANQSKPLMADISRTFCVAAKKEATRIKRLSSLSF
jgi:hypothetical protein